MNTYYCECECGRNWMCITDQGLKKYLKTIACTNCGAKPGKGMTVLVARERTISNRYDALTGRLVHTVTYLSDHKEYDEAEKLWE